MGGDQARAEVTVSSTASASLAPAFRDLDEAREDFRQAEYQTAAQVLQRFVLVTEREPMAGFLAAALPVVDLAGFLTVAEKTGGSATGSKVLAWPHDRAERVAMQLALCRSIAAAERDLLNFVIAYFQFGSAVKATVFVFQQKILEPLVRDLRRLAESLPVPAVLDQVLGRLPPSGDALLDTMLSAACAAFRDPAPGARRAALEKLWDGWERLKTLDDPADKATSARLMLRRAAPEATPLYSALDTEAKALTAIGNGFHIRHFETNKTPLTHPREVDYLFHRMYALVHLLLEARQP